MADKSKQGGHSRFKENIIENEKQDAIRDTKIAVMESQSNTILTRLDKMELTLEKIFERIEKIK